MLVLAIVVALSCFQPDVQSAINSAAAGDTVTVPSGLCGWATGVKTTKQITLKGAGSGATIIVFSGPAIKDLNPGINLGFTASRVTDFTFLFDNNADFGVRADGEGWRVDHSTFENITTSQNRYAVFSRNDGGVPCDPPGGLVDHNVFINSRVVAQGTLKLTCQHDLWSRPLKFGADQGATDVVYIEDSTFTRTIYADACDAEYAGRYVFRFNTVVNGTCEVHPVFLAQRGPRAWEIYSNVFVCPLRSCDAAIWPRGATGVAYGNTILGNYVYPIKFDNRRSFDTALLNPPGGCDGASSWDGNQFAGWPCRDQVGRGADAAPYAGTGPLPDQTSEPAYFWTNTFRRALGTLNPAEPIVANNSSGVKPGGSSADIIAGRDFISGVKPGYKAFIYPHPLNVP